MQWFQRISKGNRVVTIAVVTISIIGVLILWSHAGEILRNLSVNNKNSHNKISESDNLQVSNGNINIEKFIAQLSQNKKDQQDQDLNTSEVALQEQEQYKVIVQQLLQSTNKEKQEAVRAIERGEVEYGAKQLEVLANAQDSNVIEQKEQAIKTYLELASIYHYRDEKKSLTYLTKAYKLDYMHIQANNLYASSLVRQNKLKEAKKTFHNLLNNQEVQQTPLIQRKILGNLGNTYFRLGEVKKAIEYYEQALRISRKNRNKQEEGSYLGNLGSAYANLGEFEKARDYWKQSLTILAAINSPNAEMVKRFLETNGNVE